MERARNRSSIELKSFYNLVYAYVFYDNGLSLSKNLANGKLDQDRLY